MHAELLDQSSDKQNKTHVKQEKKVKKIYSTFSKRRKDREMRFSTHIFKLERGIGTGKWQEQQERQNKGESKKLRVYWKDVFRARCGSVRTGSLSSTLHESHP